MKKLIIILLILAIAGFGIYWKFGRSKQALPQYETVKVERGNLTQTVEATGKVESVQDLELHFETAGTLAAINVKEGDRVRAGKVLASLRLNELNAAVAQALANLNQKLAGSTREDVRYYQAAVDVARAALDQARADASSSLAEAESDLQTARNNMRQAEGGENSQIVNQAYEDAVALLQSVLPVLDDGLVQADNILGIDSRLANDSFESVLSASDPTRLSAANTLYTETKPVVVEARTAISPLTTASAHSAVDSALIKAKESLLKMSSLLSAVADVLNATPPAGGFTQATLDAKKTTIQTTRASVTAKYTSVVSQEQSIADARNSLAGYTIAYEQARRDLENARVNGRNNIAAKEAAYNQARANLDGKLARPREVDVAYYRAALSQAIANRDKAILKAPIDGVITKLNKDVGEFVSITNVAVEMLSPRYEVSVDIPETDIPKIMRRDSADITLDAFGEDIKFTGRIVSVDPASTEIQDVVYYRVKVALNPTSSTPGGAPTTTNYFQRIKPGMTANVTITTDTRVGALYIPFRAIRSSGGNRLVKVLENGLEKEVEITLGLRADNGKVEVRSGLKEGQEVALSVKK